jgi:hypothetical protein
MREEGNLDRLIDEALASYADAGPGLEERVLARVSAAQTAPRRWRLAWAVALPVAACVSLLLFVHFADNPHRAPAGQIARVVVTPPQPQPRPITAAPHAASPKVSAGATARRAMPEEPPKREVFPMPQPLSAEERALVEFATQAPEAERKAFVEAQKQSNEPIQMANIQIEAIHISPIEAPPSGAK